MSILVLPASTRSGSYNVALAQAIVTSLEQGGHQAELIDLAEYPMPLYNEDLEGASGIPAEASSLHARIDDASAVILVSPEYNGAFTPLLKNVVDWMSRIDASFLAEKRIGLASASPGPGGGARGLAMIRTWMENMDITPLSSQVVVGSAYEAFAPDGAVIKPEVAEAIGTLADELSGAIASAA